MRRRRCYTVMVDGMPARVSAVGPLTERDLEAIRELARCLRKHGTPTDRVRYEKPEPTAGDQHGEARKDP